MKLKENYKFAFETLPAYGACGVLLTVSAEGQLIGDVFGGNSKEGRRTPLFI